MSYTLIFKRYGEYRCASDFRSMDTEFNHSLWK